MFLRNVGFSSVCRLLLLVPCLAYSSTLNMEAMCSSETLGSLQITLNTFLFVTDKDRRFTLFRQQQKFPGTDPSSGRAPFKMTDHSGN
jgi:hypothetical protein